MDVLSTAINAAVVTAIAFLVGFALNGQLKALRQQIAAVHDRMARLEARMDRLETRFDDFARDVNAQLHGLRSDLTQLAIGLGVQREAESGG